MRLLQGRRAYIACAAIAIVAVGVAAASIDAVLTQQDSGIDRSGASGGAHAEARDHIRIDAAYHAQNKTAVITYQDTTAGGAGAVPVTVEILGMRESYREVFGGPEFTVMVGFEHVPKYGWSVHPIVAEVDHPVFGGIQIKTEIRDSGQPAPRTIYAQK